MSIKVLKTDLIPFKEYGIGYNDKIEEIISEKERTDLFEIINVTENNNRTTITYKLL